MKKPIKKISKKKMKSIIININIEHLVDMKGKLRSKTSALKRLLASTDKAIKELGIQK